MRDALAVSSHGDINVYNGVGRKESQKATEAGIVPSFLITYSSGPRSPARTHFLNVASTVILGTKLPTQEQRTNHRTQ